MGRDADFIHSSRTLVLQVIVESLLSDARLHVVAGLVFR